MVILNTLEEINIKNMLKSISEEKRSLSASQLLDCELMTQIKMESRDMARKLRRNVGLVLKEFEFDTEETNTIL